MHRPQRRGSKRRRLTAMGTRRKEELAVPILSLQNAAPSAVVEGGFSRALSRLHPEFPTEISGLVIQSDRTASKRDYELKSRIFRSLLR
jgi:hypothetical protein